MAASSDQAVFGRRFAANLWRLTRVYWTSPAGRSGGILLATCISLEFGAVYGSVLIAAAQKRVFDAVQDKQMAAFFAAIGGFLAIVLVFVLVSAFRIYVRQWLEMHWRRSLTAHYVERWIGPQAYTQRELHRGEADNPDQRIAEDIRIFVASALGLALSLLAALATLVSFGGLLWSLSADWPLQWFGKPLHIPGLMLWVAIVYAFVAMSLTHLVGRPLVPINFHRQRVEADFRYGLVRFRDNLEAVALARGAVTEQRRALGRFQHVVENWWLLIAAQRRLTIFTTTISQINAVVPLLIAAPAYFSGWMTLGSVAQTRVAYVQVAGALAWFVYAYQEIAQWRASIERLSSFADVIDATHADLARADGIHVATADGPALRLRDVRLTLPDGRVLLESANATIEAGQKLAVIGTAGVGKTTLFRAIAGLWSFGSGTIEMPAQARTLFLPERPYLPIGTLRDLVCYPSKSESFEDTAIRDALEALGLERLAAQLDSEVDWDNQLSGDEQQRLGVARALLHQPDWIFMDDATAALDEAVEKRVYELLAARLPRATVVAMTRRPAAAQYLATRWTLVADDAGVATLETA